uniref:Uncharacterized protein n=1 Tax=Solanum lycopersicum TaxID=4081 RepID=A0A3Q7JHQ1_SOLLC
MEIVEVVSDQVAVTLSHATVLDESQSMREKSRIEKLQARQGLRFRSNGMRQTVHSILCLLSIFQDEKASFYQKFFVNTMVMGDEKRTFYAFNQIAQSPPFICVEEGVTFREVMKGWSFSICKKIVQMTGP